MGDKMSVQSKSVITVAPNSLYSNLPIFHLNFSHKLTDYLFELSAVNVKNHFIGWFQSNQTTNLTVLHASPNKTILD